MIPNSPKNPVKESRASIIRSNYIRQNKDKQGKKGECSRKTHKKHTNEPQTTMCGASQQCQHETPPNISEKTRSDSRSAFQDQINVDHRIQQVTDENQRSQISTTSNSQLGTSQNWKEIIHKSKGTPALKREVLFDRTNCWKPGQPGSYFKNDAISLNISDEQHLVLSCDRDEQRNRKVEIKSPIGTQPVDDHSNLKQNNINNKEHVKRYGIRRSLIPRWCGSPGVQSATQIRDYDSKQTTVSGCTLVSFVSDDNTPRGICVGQGKLSVSSGKPTLPGKRLPIDPDIETAVDEYGPKIERKPSISGDLAVVYRTEESNHMHVPTPIGQRASHSNISHLKAIPDANRSNEASSGSRSAGCVSVSQSHACICSGPDRQRLVPEKRATSTVARTLVGEIDNCNRNTSVLTDKISNNSLKKSAIACACDTAVGSVCYYCPVSYKLVRTADKGDVETCNDNDQTFYGHACDALKSHEKASAIQSEEGSEGSAPREGHTIHTHEHKRTSIDFSPDVDRRDIDPNCNLLYELNGQEQVRVCPITKCQQNVENNVDLHIPDDSVGEHQTSNRGGCIIGTESNRQAVLSVDTDTGNFVYHRPINCSYTVFVSNEEQSNNTKSDNSEGTKFVKEHSESPEVSLGDHDTVKCNGLTVPSAGASNARTTQATNLPNNSSPSEINEINEHKIRIRDRGQKNSALRTHFFHDHKETFTDNSGHGESNYKCMKLTSRSRNYNNNGQCSSGLNSEQSETIGACVIKPKLIGDKTTRGNISDKQQGHLNKYKCNTAFPPCGSSRQRTRDNNNNKDCNTYETDCCSEVSFTSPVRQSPGSIPAVQEGCMPPGYGLYQTSSDGKNSENRGEVCQAINANHTEGITVNSKIQFSPSLTNRPTLTLQANDDGFQISRNKKESTNDEAVKELLLCVTENTGSHSSLLNRQFKREGANGKCRHKDAELNHQNYKSMSVSSQSTRLSSVKRRKGSIADDGGLLTTGRPDRNRSSTVVRRRNVHTDVNRTDKSISIDKTSYDQNGNESKRTAANLYLSARRCGNDGQHTGQDNQISNKPRRAFTNKQNYAWSRRPAVVSNDRIHSFGRVPSTERSDASDRKSESIKTEKGKDIHPSFRYSKVKVKNNTTVSDRKSSNSEIKAIQRASISKDATSMKDSENIHSSCTVDKCIEHVIVENCKCLGSTTAVDKSSRHEDGRGNYECSNKYSSITADSAIAVKTDEQQKSYNVKDDEFRNCSFIQGKDCSVSPSNTAESAGSCEVRAQSKGLYQCTPETQVTNCVNPNVEVCSVISELECSVTNTTAPVRLASHSIGVLVCDSTTSQITCNVTDTSDIPPYVENIENISGTGHLTSIRSDADISQDQTIQCKGNLCKLCQQFDCGCEDDLSVVESDAIPKPALEKYSADNKANTQRQDSETIRTACQATADESCGVLLQQTCNYSCSDNVNGVQIPAEKRDETLDINQYKTLFAETLTENKHCISFGICVGCPECASSETQQNHETHKTGSLYNTALHNCNCDSERSSDGTKRKTDGVKTGKLVQNGGKPVYTTSVTARDTSKLKSSKLSTMGSKVVQGKCLATSKKQPACNLSKAIASKVNHEEMEIGVSTSKTKRGLRTFTRPRKDNETRCSLMESRDSNTRPRNSVTASQNETTSTSAVGKADVVSQLKCQTIRKLQNKDSVCERTQLGRPEQIDKGYYQKKVPVIDTMKGQDKKYTPKESGITLNSKRKQSPIESKSSAGEGLFADNKTRQTNVAEKLEIRRCSSRSGTPASFSPVDHRPQTSIRKKQSNLPGQVKNFSDYKSRASEVPNNVKPVSSQYKTKPGLKEIGNDTCVTKSSQMISTGMCCIIDKNSKSKQCSFKSTGSSTATGQHKVESASEMPKCSNRLQSGNSLKQAKPKQNSHVTDTKSSIASRSKMLVKQTDLHKGREKDCAIGSSSKLGKPRITRNAGNMDQGVNINDTQLKVTSEQSTKAVLVVKKSVANRDHGKISPEPVKGKAKKSKLLYTKIKQEPARNYPNTSKSKIVSNRKTITATGSSPITADNDSQITECIVLPAENSNCTPIPKRTASDSQRTHFSDTVCSTSVTYNDNDVQICQPERCLPGHNDEGFHGDNNTTDVAGSHCGKETSKDAAFVIPISDKVNDFNRTRDSCVENIGNLQKEHVCNSYKTEETLTIERQFEAEEVRSRSQFVKVDSEERTSSLDTEVDFDGALETNSVQRGCVPGDSYLPNQSVMVESEMFPDVSSSCIDVKRIKTPVLDNGETVSVQHANKDRKWLVSKTEMAENITCIKQERSKLPVKEKSVCYTKDFFVKLDLDKMNAVQTNFLQDRPVGSDKQDCFSADSSDEQTSAVADCEFSSAVGGDSVHRIITDGSKCHQTSVRKTPSESSAMEESTKRICTNVCVLSQGKDLLGNAPCGRLMGTSQSACDISKNKSTVLMGINALQYGITFGANVSQCITPVTNEDNMNGKETTTGYLDNDLGTVYTRQTSVDLENSKESQIKNYTKDDPEATSSLLNGFLLDHAVVSSNENQNVLLNDPAGVIHGHCGTTDSDIRVPVSRENLSITSEEAQVNLPHYIPVKLASVFDSTELCSRCNSRTCTCDCANAHYIYPTSNHELEMRSVKCDVCGINTGHNSSEIGGSCESCRKTDTQREEIMSSEIGTNLFLTKSVSLDTIKVTTSHTSDQTSNRKQVEVRERDLTARALKPDTSLNQTSCSVSDAQELCEILRADKDKCFLDDKPKKIRETQSSCKTSNHLHGNARLLPGSIDDGLIQYTPLTGRAISEGTRGEIGSVSTTSNACVETPAQMSVLSHVNIISQQSSRNDGVKEKSNQPDDRTVDGRDYKRGNLLIPYRDSHRPETDICEEKSSNKKNISEQQALADSQLHQNVLTAEQNLIDTVETLKNVLTKVENVGQKNNGTDETKHRTTPGAKLSNSTHLTEHGVCLHEVPSSDGDCRCFKSHFVIDTTAEVLCDQTTKQVEILDDTSDNYVDAEDTLNGTDPDDCFSSGYLFSATTSLESFHDAVENLDETDFESNSVDSSIAHEATDNFEVDMSLNVQGNIKSDECDSFEAMEKGKMATPIGNSGVKDTPHIKASRVTQAAEYRTTSVLRDKAYLCSALGSSHGEETQTQNTSLRYEDIVHESVLQRRANGTLKSRETVLINSYASTGGSDIQMEKQVGKLVETEPVTKAADIHIACLELGSCEKKYILDSKILSEQTNSDTRVNRPVTPEVMDQRKTSQYVTLTENFQNSETEQLSFSNTEVQDTYTRCKLKPPSTSKAVSDVSTKIETAVTIRTERRRRRQIGKENNSSSNDPNALYSSPIGEFGVRNEGQNDDNASSGEERSEDISLSMIPHRTVVDKLNVTNPGEEHVISPPACSNYEIRNEPSAISEIDEAETNYSLDSSSCNAMSVDESSSDIKSVFQITLCPHNVSDHNSIQLSDEINQKRDISERGQKTVDDLSISATIVLESNDQIDEKGMRTELRGIHTESEFNFVQLENSTESFGSIEQKNSDGCMTSTECVKCESQTSPKQISIVNVNDNVEGNIIAKKTKATHGITFDTDSTSETRTIIKKDASEKKANRRSLRRATAAICTVNEDCRVGDTEKMKDNVSHKSSCKTIKKSSSFKIEREKHETENHDGSAIDIIETDVQQFKKVSEICKTFIQKTKASVVRTSSEDTMRKCQSPVPVRKLMKWVNQDGKWLRVPVDKNSYSTADTDCDSVRNKTLSKKRKEINAKCPDNCETKTEKSEDKETDEQNEDKLPKNTEKHLVLMPLVKPKDDEPLLVGPCHNDLLENKHYLEETHSTAISGLFQLVSKNNSSGNCVDDADVPFMDEDDTFASPTASKECDTDIHEGCLDFSETSSCTAKELKTEDEAFSQMDVTVNLSKYIHSIPDIDNHEKIPSLVSDEEFEKNTEAEKSVGIKVTSDYRHTCGDSVATDKIETSNVNANDNGHQSNIPIKTTIDELNAQIRLNPEEPYIHIMKTSTNYYQETSDNFSEMKNDESKINHIEVSASSDMDRPSDFTTEGDFRIDNTSGLGDKDTRANVDDKTLSKCETNTENTEKCSTSNCTTTYTGIREVSESETSRANMDQSDNKHIATICNIDQCRSESGTQMTREQLLFGIRDQYRRRKPFTKLSGKAQTNCTHKQRYGDNVAPSKNTTTEIIGSTEDIRQASFDGKGVKSKPVDKKTDNENRAHVNDTLMRIPKLKAVKIQEELFMGKSEYTKECNVNILSTETEFALANQSSCPVDGKSGSDDDNRRPCKIPIVTRSESLDRSLFRKVQPSPIVKSKTLSHIQSVNERKRSPRFYIGSSKDDGDVVETEGSTCQFTVHNRQSERNEKSNTLPKSRLQKGLLPIGYNRQSGTSGPSSSAEKEEHPKGICRVKVTEDDGNPRSDVNSKNVWTKPGGTDKRVAVLERQKSLNRNKLLSEIAEESGNDSHLNSPDNETGTGSRRGLVAAHPPEVKVKRGSRKSSKRRSLSLPTGTLVFGEAKIVYRNGHFTIETPDGTEIDSTRHPQTWSTSQLEQKCIPSVKERMHVDPVVDNMETPPSVPKGEVTLTKPHMRRQVGRTALDEKSFLDQDVFENSLSEQTQNDSLSLENGVCVESDGVKTTGHLTTRCHSSSSLPDTGSDEVKVVAQRARRTSSFRQAQEQGSFRLSGIEEDKDHVISKRRSQSVDEHKCSDQNTSMQSANNASFFQRMLNKRRSVTDNTLKLAGFAKQSDSAKEFFARRMSLKGLFKRNKSDTSVGASPLKTVQTPVSPPIAAFQSDEDIGSVDSAPCSPCPSDIGRDLRRRHTSADIFSHVFADASSASALPESSLARVTSPREEDQVSITSSGSVSSSVHSVQSPIGEQPNKPKTPKPVGTSPRRNPLSQQISRTSSNKGSISSVDVVSDSELRTSGQEKVTDQLNMPNSSCITSLADRCKQLSRELEESVFPFHSTGYISVETIASAGKANSNSVGKLNVSGSSDLPCQTVVSTLEVGKPSTGPGSDSDKTAVSRVGYDKLIISQVEMTGSHSNDSGIQHDVSVHSSNDSLKGAADVAVRLRRKKSLSPHQERPRSEVAVRWADLDNNVVDMDTETVPVKLRQQDQNIKDRPRPKSDLESNVQLFDDLFVDLLEDYESDGCSFLMGGMRAFGSETNLAAYCSLRNLYEIRRTDSDQTKKSRRMSTPHPIKSRLQRSPRKVQKHVALVRSSSMPESLEKLQRPRKMHHLLDFHLDSLSRQMDLDGISVDSDLSFDQMSLQDITSIQSSNSQLTSMDEEEENWTYAEALWDHITMDPEELGFRAGDLIEVSDLSDKDWWFGSIQDIEGWFPAAFVRLRVNQDQLEEDLDATLREDLSCSPKLRRISVINKDQARANVVNEIINAEREYVKHLKDVVEGYIQHARKRKDMFSEDRILLIFGNIEEIYEYSCKFLSQLEKCIDNCPHRSQIGTCFLDNVRGFEIYSDYCNNHPSACEELKKLYHDTKFRHFFEACRLLQELIEIPLEGFLLTPVQKICKYPLQLAELLKYTPPDHPDYLQVDNALSAMRKIATLINERKRKMESIEKIAAWQQTVDDWEGPDLLEGSSELIHSGEINKINSAGWSQERYFFLFDHQLIYCKKELLKRHVFSYKGRIDLDHCEILPLNDGKDVRYNVTVKHAWKLHETLKDKWYLLYAKTAAGKERWLKALQDERRRVQEDRDNDFSVPEHWKQTVLNKVKSLKDKQPGRPEQDLYKDIPAHATLPRRRPHNTSQKQEKKRGWFPFTGIKKSKK